MRIHPCVEIFSLGEALGRAEGEVASKAGSTIALTQPVSDATKEKLRAVLAQLGPESGHAFVETFPFTTEAMGRLQSEIVDDPAAKEWRLSELLRDLCNRLRDELKRDLYVEISPAMVPYVLHPEIGWEESAEIFPDAADDMLQASQCFGLERYTACVFHLMRILEHGLRDVADRFKIEFNDRTWYPIIRDIETAIRELRKDPKKLTDEQRADIAFYSDVATEFSYFKDAWRNHVSHAKSVYDGGQSYSIYVHVRDFMRKLASRPSTDSGASNAVS